MHIAGNEKVQPSVAVIVAPCRAVGPIAQSHTGLLGHVRETTVMVVVVEPVLAEVSHEDIRPPIVIEVADSDAKAPSGIGNAGLGRSVGKGARMGTGAA